MEYIKCKSHTAKMSKKSSRNIEVITTQKEIGKIGISVPLLLTKSTFGHHDIQLSTSTIYRKEVSD